MADETKSPLRVAGLLLAAGGSIRLGRPKQLVEFEGRTLVKRAAEALIKAGCSPVVVVLGAEINASTAELAGLAVEIAINDDWESGMSSSIRVGMRSVGDADAVLISLVDQPLVTVEKLKLLNDSFMNTEHEIVAAEYDGITGVPAVFARRLFPALAALEGDKGAREVIRNSPDALAIPLPEAAIDVDKTTDLRRFAG